jgi:serine/threonine-protein kinase
MAPEQFQGVRTDQRSDVYAVGAVLYHALLGEPPYGGQVLRFLVGDDRVAREPLPVEAAALAPLVDRALLRDAEARFPDAPSMLEALLAVGV